MLKNNENCKKLKSITFHNRNYLYKIEAGGIFENCNLCKKLMSEGEMNRCMPRHGDG